MDPSGPAGAASIDPFLHRATLMHRTIPVHGDGHRMRIFLVEDNALSREILEQWLTLVPGAQVVHVAATSGAAVDWLGRNADGWDLAVIDLFLADGHGFDVLRRCRGRAAQQRAVMLTNYTRDPVRESARREGADAVFDKGGEMKEFITWCRDYQLAIAG